MHLLEKRPLAAALFIFFAGFFLLSNLSFIPRAILFLLSLLSEGALLLLKKRNRLVLSSLFLFALAAVLLILSTDLPDYAIAKRKDETATYSFRTLYATDEENNVWLVGSVSDGNGRLFCRLSVDLPDDLPVKPGDVLSGEGTVVPLSTYARRGLYGKGCRGRLKLSGDVAVTGRRASFRAPFLGLASAVREALSSRVEGEDGGLLVAVLLGETEELPTGTELLFRRAGVSHALAVSGMHLVFLSAALAFLFRRLGLTRPAVSVLTVLFAFFYAALAGFTPSVVRAALMLAVYHASWFAKRQPDSLTSLALSGALMLICAPYLIYSVSFLLSYLATLGILLAAQFTRTKTRAHRPLPLRFARRIGTFALLTLFAVLFTLPVTSALFGELSLLSIPANLLLSLPIQFLLYLAVAVLALPFPFVGRLAEGYCSLFLSVLRRVAALPLAPLTFSSNVLTFASLLPILALLAVAFFKLSRKKRAVLITVAGTLTLAAFLVFALPVKTDGRVVLLSDGKDEDLIVLREGRRAACVDLGDPDGILSMLETELKSDRIAEIDEYLFSAYGDGTTDRFRALLSEVYIRRVLLPAPKPSERREYDALVSLLDLLSIAHEPLPEESDPLGFHLRLQRYDPRGGNTTVPVVLAISAGDGRLLYVGEEVAIADGTTLPAGTTDLFLGCHGETRYVSFTLGLPDSVRAVFTGSEFYTTCSFPGGSPDLVKQIGKRFVPAGFAP